jgi:hypothetical protein
LPTCSPAQRHRLRCALAAPEGLARIGASGHRCASSWRASTGLTTVPSSSPDWAMPATASST